MSIDYSWNATHVHICHNVPYVDPNRSSSGPFEECLQECRELFHNSGKHNSSQIIKLYLCNWTQGDSLLNMCYRPYMYGRMIYGSCISAQLLETAALRRETGLAAPGKAAVHWFFDWTAACVCPQWDKAATRLEWMEPRLAALVGPVYIRDWSFKG